MFFFCMLWCVLLTGCQPSSQERQKKTLSETCLPSEIHLSSRLPSGEHVGGYGFFVTANTLVSASHVVPHTGILEDSGDARLRIIHRDQDHDIVQLSSSVCGAPLSLSSEHHIGDRVFSCTTGNLRGEIIKENASSVSQVSHKTLLRTHLLFISGKYMRGESGRPFCNERGEVIGILLSVQETGGFLMPSSVVGFGVL